jgi:hypothetical protein
MDSLGREPQETEQKRGTSRGAATDKKPRQHQSAKKPFVMIDPVLREQNY